MERLSKRVNVLIGTYLVQLDHEPLLILRVLIGETMTVPSVEEFDEVLTRFECLNAAELADEVNSVLNRPGF